MPNDMVRCSADSSVTMVRSAFAVYLKMLWCDVACRSGSIVNFDTSGRALPVGSLHHLHDDPALLQCRRRQHRLFGVHFAEQLPWNARFAYDVLLQRVSIADLQMLTHNDTL